MQARTAYRPPIADSSSLCYDMAQQLKHCPAFPTAAANPLNWGALNPIPAGARQTYQIWAHLNRHASLRHRVRRMSRRRVHSTKGRFVRLSHLAITGPEVGQTAGRLGVDLSPRRLAPVIGGLAPRPSSRVWLIKRRPTG